MTDIYTYAAKIVGPEPIGDACTCDYSGPCDWHGTTGRERDLARALIKVYADRGGEWCAKNREEGRGPCGACAWCCKQALDRAERAEALIQQALVEAREHYEFDVLPTAEERLANVRGLLGGGS